jgi:large subunit ribosomal protein L18
VVDDRIGHTIAAASSIEPTLSDDVGGKSKKEQAAAVGRVVADRALAAGIEEVVFDRGGYRYSGRVRALAEAAREAGLRL